VVREERTEERIECATVSSLFYSLLPARIPPTLVKRGEEKRKEGRKQNSSETLILHFTTYRSAMWTQQKRRRGRKKKKKTRLHRLLFVSRANLRKGDGGKEKKRKERGGKNVPLQEMEEPDILSSLPLLPLPLYSGCRGRHRKRGRGKGEKRGREKKKEYGLKNGQPLQLILTSISLSLLRCKKERGGRKKMRKKTKKLAVRRGQR